MTNDEVGEGLPERVLLPKILSAMRSADLGCDTWEHDPDCRCLQIELAALIDTRTPASGDEVESEDSGNEEQNLAVPRTESQATPALDVAHGVMELWARTYIAGIESENDLSGEVENWSDFHRGQVWAAKELLALATTQATKTNAVSNNPDDTPAGTLPHDRESESVREAAEISVQLIDIQNRLALVRDNAYARGFNEGLDAMRLHAVDVITSSRDSAEQEKKK